MAGWSWLIAPVLVERNSGVRLEARFALAAEHPDHDAYECSDEDEKIDRLGHGCAPRYRPAARVTTAPPIGGVRKATTDRPPAHESCIEIDQHPGDLRISRRSRQIRDAWQNATLRCVARWGFTGGPWPFDEGGRHETRAVDPGRQSSL